MGLTITTKPRPGAGPGVRIFELDRSLTGMGIERYAARPAESATRPPDVLARRLFDQGATSVTVYSNLVTVSAPESAWTALEPGATAAIERLFEYYGEEAGWSPEARGLAPADPATER